ncbi:VOC family protein [Sinosporangium siamense]|uniref:Glyoxalase n=1 Tax=Sinosporangium siamense TaxID=1367973 RepID=A0A919V8K3_9ACTN|nr:VOC family protein [Sinosporangium siamense]GII96225.1 glyoxalase [Sinosporangium siamense]
MIRFACVTVDAADPYELAHWWAGATGWAVEEGAQAGDDQVMLQAPGAPGQPDVLFLRVPEGKSVKNRLHFDVEAAPGGSRDAEVERLVKLGAVPYEDHRAAEGGKGWMTLLDPEGNEFCICSNEAERAVTG